MTLFAFIITCVKYQLKLLSAKFQLQLSIATIISMQWTLYNYLLYDITEGDFAKDEN